MSTCRKAGANTRRLGRLAALAFLLPGCSRSGPDPEQLAARGAIEANAPVQASADIAVAASPEKIWAVLADIHGWPAWQPDISKVSIDSPPAPGVRFDWSSGGSSIHSRIALFDPTRTMSWTGRVLQIHAIHVWKMSRLADGRTLVSTRESMSGWLIALFISSRELQQSDQRWLAALKRAAEA